MIFSNTDQHGGKLIDVLDREFANAKSVSVASGYTSLDILDRYKNEFTRIANNGGVSRLLVGMAFYEGLSQRKLDMLNTLSRDLRQIDASNGVFVCYTRKYHGKIYRFDKEQESDFYIGSSNFSRSGISENIEATIPIVDQLTQNSTSDFLDYLFSEDVSTHIEDAEITVPGSNKFKQSVSIATLTDLQRYDVNSIDYNNKPSFEFDLSRIVDKEKSSLNVYFGKGRWTRSTGKVKPRDWYEVELIAPGEINRLDIYPRGNFTAYTDDGLVLPMRTSGDYNKNIRSKDNLKLLGMWIKGKLQAANALVPLTPVTQDTLDLYGKSSIKFYQLSDTKYYLEF